MGLPVGEVKKVSPTGKKCRYHLRTETTLMENFMLAIRLEKHLVVGMQDLG